MIECLNEVKTAEYILSNGYVEHKIGNILFIIAKYYRQVLNYSENETINALNKFLETNYKDYDVYSFKKLISNCVKSSNKYKIRNINSIPITESEINLISSLKNMKHEKLLFSMLCFAKLYNSISENNHNWINTSISDIFNVAKVNYRLKKDKFLYLNDIFNLGYISFSKKNDNLNIQVNIIDVNSKPILNISDFRELGYEYEYFKTNKKNNFMRCKKCNRLIKRITNNQLYCPICRKK